jgi:hypothetical protein
VYAEYPDEPGTCAYCERPEADHDDRALHGPYTDPQPHPGAVVAGS